MKSIPIFQMASFSRSGETLLLRTLAAHPQLSVVHQLFEPDIEEDLELFRVLMNSGETSIPLNHKNLQHRQNELNEHSALILKNAVWEQKTPYKGFILVRNPFSIMRSAHVLEKETTDAGLKNHMNQILRWGNGIDKDMVPYLMQTDSLEAFCLLYARKMLIAHATGLPIVHYERFVSDPETTLRKLLAALEIPWHENLLKAHESYEEGQIGHGRIKLWHPIHKRSLANYQEVKTEIFQRIYAYTSTALHFYGYQVGEDKSIEIDPDIDCRM